MKITKQEIKKFFTPHFIKLYSDNFEDEIKTEEISPTKLLSPRRFDLLLKYAYACHKVNNRSIDFATEVYKDHIGSWNNFIEGDGSKNSFKDYKDNFDYLLENTFDSKKSIIPTSKDGVIIDGAHRTTACIINNNTPTIARLNIPAPNYNYSYFRKQGTQEKYLDYAALKYIELDSSLYILFLFPIARDKDEEVKEIIKNYSEIVYTKELVLTENGMHNLVVQSYRDESWIGNEKNNYLGARRNAESKFYKKNKLKVFIIKTENYEKTLEIKNKIRTIFSFGNNSVHITDNHEETLRLGQQILNSNSLHFLNYRTRKNNENFKFLFKKYKANYHKLALNIKKDFCIDSSAVMAAYGLRDARDIDYLTTNENKNLIEQKDIDCHNSELKYYPLALIELVHNPDNYFYYDGVKFLSLENVKKMKSIRKEEKDLQDIKLIEEIEMETWYSQNGEDFILNELFKNQENGFFVEVGCIDGVRFSNTYKFEKKGWKGICIEAHQDYIPFLESNRPNSKVLNCAVGEKDEDNVIFYANSRGSLSTLDKSQEEHFKNHYGKYFTGFKEQIVSKRTLSTIFKENEVKNVDILSIDIEGSEIEAIKGLDFAKVKPKVIVIESTGGEHEYILDVMLITNGYKKLFRLSENIFYALDLIKTDLLKKEYTVKLLTTENPFDKEGNIEFDIKLKLHKYPTTHFTKKVLQDKNIYLKNRMYVKDAYSQQKRLVGINDKKLIIDGGAYKGDISELYTRLFPNSEIHAFEPFEESYSELLKKSQEFYNIIPNKLALGSKVEKNNFNINIGKPTNSLLETHNEASYYWSADWCKTINKVEVEITTIDYYCKQNNIEQIDVLKLDLQGYEYEALKGAETMLSNNKILLIYLEVILTSTYIGQKSLAQIADYLDRHGYRLFNIYNPIISKNSELNQIDAIFILNSNRI